MLNWAKWKWSSDVGQEASGGMRESRQGFLGRILPNFLPPAFQRNILCSPNNQLKVKLLFLNGGIHLKRLRHCQSPLLLGRDSHLANHHQTMENLGSLLLMALINFKRGSLCIGNLCIGSHVLTNTLSVVDVLSGQSCKMSSFWCSS